MPLEITIELVKRGRKRLRGVTEIRITETEALVTHENFVDSAKLDTITIPTDIVDSIELIQRGKNQAADFPDDGVDDRIKS